MKVPHNWLTHVHQVIWCYVTEAVEHKHRQFKVECRSASTAAQYRTFRTTLMPIPVDAFYHTDWMQEVRIKTDLCLASANFEPHV